MPKRRASSDFTINNEIQIARGRLKGILQDLAELDDEYDDENTNLPLRGRPPKRPKNDKSDSVTSVHESFVMKLFDRSLDLAKFEENSALYSVCRAWNMNKPNAKYNENENDQRMAEPLKREQMLDLNEKILKDNIGYVLNMPAPIGKKEDEACLSTKGKRTIDQLPQLKAGSNIELLRDELFKDHKSNWKNTKKNWLLNTKKRHDRYQLSFRLLNAIREM